MTAVVDPQPDQSERATAVIRTAIADGLPIAFVYERADGAFTRHNAVYPRVLFQQGHHTLMRAHCHFTRDSRLFRVDRIQSIRLSGRPEVATFHDYLGALVAIILILAIFLSLLLFSPKPRWRHLRNRLLGSSPAIEVLSGTGRSDGDLILRPLRAA